MAEHYQVPEWFQDGKIGVWMHWGIPSSVDENRPNDGSHYGRRMYGNGDFDGNPTVQTEMNRLLHEWHEQRYGPVEEFGYEDLVPLFQAEQWDPDELVRFFKTNGARFIMPVACHHDNFDMYDSFHPWNSMDMGPKRDTLKEWKQAAHKHGLKFGVSTHLYWSPSFFNTARPYQKEGTLAWQLFNMDYDPRDYASQDSWNEHWYARCWEIIDKYDPDMFNNDAPFPDEKRGKSLGIQLFSSFVNRDLKENEGRQTVVFSCKSGNKPKAAFTYNLERGSAGDIKPEPWMWATDLSGGWFYRKGAVNRMSIPVMVGNAVDAVSKNGVVMLNVALRGDGTLPENQAAYLTTFGAFLETCGEGIYDTRPWKVFGEGPLKMKDGRQGENKALFSQQDIRFTCQGDTLYAFVLAKPTDDIVIKTLAQGGLYEDEIGSIRLLGSDEAVTWKRSAEALTIQLPKTLSDQPVIGFRITPARTARRRDHYPAFSWDTVPLYVHIRKDTAFTDEEIRYLASFPLITFEKATGHRDSGSVEAGTLKAARAVKAFNPDTKILYYRNVIVHYGGYAANISLKDIPGAFLAGRDGNDKLIRNRLQAYDLSNKALRDWWIDAVNDICSDPSVDGVFLDGVVKVLEPVFLKGVITPEKKAAELAGYVTLVADTRKRLGPQKLMLANILRARFSDSGLRYIKALDGSYIEGFEGAVGMSRKDYVAQGIRDFQKAARQGAIIAYTCGLGSNQQDADETPRSAAQNRNSNSVKRDVKSRFYYQLAIFLICAEKYSYFDLKDSYDAKTSKTWMTHPADYDRPLGPPKGPAVRDGYTYTREFAHVSVQLDIEKETANIVWKSQQRD
jgi:alpha-L-fucosidase